MSHTTETVVTIGGECFEIEFERSEADSNRDGSLFLFRVRDLRQQRGERLVQLFKSGQLGKSFTDYAIRSEIARLNAIRRAFDSGTLNFDVAYDPERYQEVKLTASDFRAGRTASEKEIRQYVKQKAYGWDGDTIPNRVGTSFNSIEKKTWII